MKLILLAAMLCTGLSAFSTEVKEASPTKVVIVTDNAGNVIIRDPSALDYQYAEAQAKAATAPRSLKDIILGRGKCHKRQ